MKNLTKEFFKNTLWLQTKWSTAERNDFIQSCKHFNITISSNTNFDSDYFYITENYVLASNEANFQDIDGYNESIDKFRDDFYQVIKLKVGNMYQLSGDKAYINMFKSGDPVIILTDEFICDGSKCIVVTDLLNVRTLVVNVGDIKEVSDLQIGCIELLKNFAAADIVNMINFISRTPKYNN